MSRVSHSRTTAPSAAPRQKFARQRNVARRLCILAVAWLFAASGAFFSVPLQAAPPPPPPDWPQETARLLIEGREPGTIGVSVAPAGPLFELLPLTDALGVELIVGPLEESHRLIYPDKEILVGPDRAVTVRITEGKRQEPIVLFSQPPVKTLTGLRVPLDFLELALGDEVGYDFAWDAEFRELDVRQREMRRLDVEIDIIHQRTSTVEVRFSEPPRYRVQREPGILSVELRSDRVRLPLRESRTASPFIRDIVASPQGIRFLLTDDASAGEPRLIDRSLVFDIFYQPPLPDSQGEEVVEETPAPSSFGQKPVSGIRTIVLDPGHGGDEAGAVGRGGTTEKDLTLLIARSLRRELHRRLPVRVILTRDSDVDVPLESRTAIANQNKADLFISLHFNSTYGAAAEGAETFFLNREASDQLAAELAAAENALGADDGEDLESDLQLILWDLTQTYHLAESQRFANLVQEELNQALGIRDRGVKQAPFRVLMGAAMPAVLVELGFLNHPDEEARLQDPAYRRDLVDSLLRAVTRFKLQIEARENLDQGFGDGARSEDRR